MFLARYPGRCPWAIPFCPFRASQRIALSLGVAQKAGVAFAPTGHQVKAQGNALGLKCKEPKALKGRDNSRKHRFFKDDAQKAGAAFEPQAYRSQRLSCPHHLMLMPVLID